MADVNRVILIGRLTRDAELKYTSGGMAICKFAVAVNKRRKNGEQWVEEAHFFDIVLWGRAGEAINQYLVKGKQVAVEGELSQNRWEQDGQSRSKVEIMATNVQLLGGGQASSGQQGTSGYAPSSGGYTDRASSDASSAYAKKKSYGGDEYGDYSPSNTGGSDDFPDDIPF